MESEWLAGGNARETVPGARRWSADRQFDWAGRRRPDRWRGHARNASRRRAARRRPDAMGTHAAALLRARGKDVDVRTDGVSYELLGCDCAGAACIPRRYNS